MNRSSNLIPLCILINIQIHIWLTLLLAWLLVNRGVLSWNLHIVGCCLVLIQWLKAHRSSRVLISSWSLSILLILLTCLLRLTRCATHIRDIVLGRCILLPLFTQRLLLCLLLLIFFLLFFILLPLLLLLLLLGLVSFLLFTFGFLSLFLEESKSNEVEYRPESITNELLLSYIAIFLLGFQLQQGEVLWMTGLLLLTMVVHLDCLYLANLNT